MTLSVDSDPHCGRDKPDEEIEITEEMLKAGIVAFVGYDSRFDLEEDAVCKIYKEMVTAKRRGKMAAKVGIS